MVDFDVKSLQIYGIVFDGITPLLLISTHSTHFSLGSVRENMLNHWYQVECLHYRPATVLWHLYDRDRSFKGQDLKNMYSTDR